MALTPLMQQLIAERNKPGVTQARKDALNARLAQEADKLAAAERAKAAPPPAPAPAPAPGPAPAPTPADSATMSPGAQTGITPKPATSTTDRANNLREEIIKARKAGNDAREKQLIAALKKENEAAAAAQQPAPATGGDAPAAAPGAPAPAAPAVTDRSPAAQALRDQIAALRKKENPTEADKAKEKQLIAQLKEKNEAAAAAQPGAAGTPATTATPAAPVTDRSPAAQALREQIAAIRKQPNTPANQAKEKELIAQLTKLNKAAADNAAEAGQPEAPLTVTDQTAEANELRKQIAALRKKENPTAADQAKEKELVAQLKEKNEAARQAALQPGATPLTGRAMIRELIAQAELAEKNGDKQKAEALRNQAREQAQAFNPFNNPDFKVEDIQKAPIPDNLTGIDNQLKNIQNRLNFAKRFGQTQMQAFLEGRLQEVLEARNKFLQGNPGQNAPLPEGINAPQTPPQGGGNGQTPPANNTNPNGGNGQTPPAAQPPANVQQQINNRIETLEKRFGKVTTQASSTTNSGDRTTRTINFADGSSWTVITNKDGEIVGTRIFNSRLAQQNAANLRETLGAGGEIIVVS